jgi:hypothetical protein
MQGHIVNMTLLLPLLLLPAVLQAMCVNTNRKADCEAFGVKKTATDASVWRNYQQPTAAVQCPL